MISVVDYGIGNVGSVVNMLTHVGAKTDVVATPEGIGAARALLLPGVGHFGHAMEVLHDLGFVDALKRRVLEDGVPILGICLGMQLLARRSEEGDSEGLGFIDARFERIAPDAAAGLKVPHMGWNRVHIQRESPLLSAAETEPRFYFVHSYKAVCENPTDIIATCKYGEEFCCAYGRDNIYGVQFHPEKSHRFGMELMRRFAEFAC